MNRDLSKFEPPKAEPDGLTKKLFGLPTERTPAKIPFTEDQFFRISTNTRILSRDLHKEGYGELQESIEQLLDYAGSLHDKFADQFHHNPRARRICPNPECHSIYAYFYEDFLYCPKCGTKLEAGYPKEQKEEKISRLERQLSKAGDRRDWDECERLEKEIDKLNKEE